MLYARKGQNVMIKNYHIHISTRRPSVASDNFPSGNSWYEKLNQDTIASFHILLNFLFTSNSQI
jgi:hypothetical protein